MGPRKSQPGGRILDAFHNTLPVPVEVTVGKAFNLATVARNPWSQVTTEWTLWAVTNLGDTNTCALRGAFNGATSTVVSMNTVSSTLASSASGTASAPTTGRAMKATVTINNVTAQLSMGGRIFVLNSDQRMALAAAPASMTYANWRAVADAIIEHPNTKSFSGADFKHGLSFSSHVVDYQQYLDFNNWRGAVGYEQYLDSTGVWPGSTERAKPMSVVWVVVERPADQQEYEFSFNGQWYTRWPLNTIPGQQQAHIPTTSGTTVAAIHRSADALGEGVPAVRSSRSGGGTW